MIKYQKTAKMKEGTGEERRKGQAKGEKVDCEFIGESQEVQFEEAIGSLILHISRP